MKKQILLAGFLTFSVASTAFAASYYDGSKISDREGPDFEVEETLSAEQSSAVSAKKAKGEQKQVQLKEQLHQSQNQQCLFYKLS